MILLQRKEVRRVLEPRFPATEGEKAPSPAVPLLVQEVLGGLEEQRQLRARQLGEGNFMVRVVGMKTRVVEQALTPQCLQIDEPPVAGERGVAEVGGVVLAVRRQGEDLPQ